MTKKLSILLVALLALAACGDDAGDELPGEPVCIPDTAAEAPDFVGLGEEEAQEMAESRGLDVREVGRDGECFPVTLDLRQDRVNLEYVGDVVVGAGIY
jgi:hypothetical protein